jgi:hypothetical protein
MPRRLTNDLLLALLLAQVVGGLLGWALPVASVAPVYGLHRALGVAVIVLLVWKQAIALSSLRRRLKRRRWDRSIVWGSVAGLLAVERARRARDSAVAVRRLAHAAQAAAERG